MLKRFASVVSGGGASALSLPACQQQDRKSLFYSLATARWHMDQRPIVNMVLVHDLMGSAEAWSPLTNSIARFPQGPYSPASPLYMYSVELRGHRKSLDPADVRNSEGATMMSHACDVSDFCSRHLIHSSTGAAHVVGLGFGARVAALYALANPSQVASLTLLLPRGNLFEPADVALPKLQLLASVAQKNKTLAACRDALRPLVPNPTELVNLLHLLEEDAGAGCVKLMLDTRQLVSPSLTAWPDIGSSARLGSSQPVTVLHSSAVDEQVSKRTQQIFPCASFVTTRVNMALGAISREDSDLLAEQVLRYSVGIATQPVEEVEGEGENNN
jgi:pimeloyl-ACP methyl ester carboxylesterase